MATDSPIMWRETLSRERTEAREAALKEMEKHKSDITKYILSRLDVEELCVAVDLNEKGDRVTSLTIDDNYEEDEDTVTIDISDSNYRAFFFAQELLRVFGDVWKLPVGEVKHDATDGHFVLIDTCVMRSVSPTPI